MLDGQVAFVTGGSGAVGAAIVRILVRHGRVWLFPTIRTRSEPASCRKNCPAPEAKAVPIAWMCSRRKAPRIFRIPSNATWDP